MHLGRLLHELHLAESGLASEFRRVGQRHPGEYDVARICEVLARQCAVHANRLGAHLARYAEHQPGNEAAEPTRTDNVLGFLRRMAAQAGERRMSPGLVLLDDLTDLYLAITRVDVLWTQAGQAAQALRDPELLDTVTLCDEQTVTQLRWVRTRIKESAPQSLVVD